VSDEKIPTVQEMFATLLKRVIGREALMLGAFAIVIAGVVLYGQHAFGQTIKSSVDEGVLQVKDDAERTKARLDQHLREDAEFRLQILRRLDEQQADTRSLYKAVMTGRRQSRLEQSPPKEEEE
jgi:hypothetical protein